MQTLNGVEIQYHRDAILRSIEQFAGDLMEDLKRRKCNLHNFRHYAGFFSAAVFDLFSWEQITRADIKKMPKLQAYFCAGVIAARGAYSAYGRRDKEFDRGQPRRTFADITVAELAVSILPRLENIMICWGLSWDDSGNPALIPLTGEENVVLSRYYHTPSDL